MEKFIFCILLNALTLNIFAQIDDYFSDLAGSWYPTQKKQLEEDIAKFANEASEQISSGINAVILPHAGYIYSGKTAMKALNSLKKSYETIIIIGPSHRRHMPDTISVPLINSYSTPLGRVPVNIEKAQKLISSSVIFKNYIEALNNEHSVQIIVPLLQYKNIATKTKIIFLITGQLSYNSISEAAKNLSAITDENTLIIVSSDFTHYGPRFGYEPFKDNIAEKIREIDMKAFSYIEKSNPEDFFKFVNEKNATICGYVPLAILANIALDKKLETRLIDYSDSSAVSADDQNRVSYISAVLYNSENKAAAAEQKLNRKDRETLLKLARKSIQFALKNKRAPKIEELNIELTENIKKHRASFVTIKINGQLRGCIGDVFPTQPLYQSVINNAFNSAFRDPRFKPLTDEEFESIDIEISAMTMPQKVNSYDEIVIGRDGIILSKASRSALFLPQVATEQGWTLEETLSYLAQKAGLPPDAWKTNCLFQTFQAEIFGEK